VNRHDERKFNQVLCDKNYAWKIEIDKIVIIIF